MSSFGALRATAVNYLGIMQSVSAMRHYPPPCATLHPMYHDTMPRTTHYHLPLPTTNQHAPPRTTNAVHPNVERPAERCFELIGKRKLLKNLIQLSTRVVYIPTLENKMKRWGKARWNRGKSSEEKTNADAGNLCTFVATRIYFITMKDI